jgi:hypothetical protein
MDVSTHKMFRQEQLVGKQKRWTIASSIGVMVYITIANTKKMQENQDSKHIHPNSYSIRVCCKIQKRIHLSGMEREVTSIHYRDLSAEQP